MPETISQKVSLVGQVVEDLSFDPLESQRFNAALKGLNKQPYYKNGGYFAFTNLTPGTYTLIVSGERFQTQEIPVTIPAAPIVFDPNKSKLDQLLERVVFAQPGDNELIVVVTNVNGGNQRISFDPVIVRRPIKANATVITKTTITKLAAKLDPGSVTSARLDSIAGINSGDIVRIIRDSSIRMRFDPYANVLGESGRVTGTVTLQNQPQVFLKGASISLTEINGGAIAVADVGGAKVATAVIGGSQVVLGTERDIRTTSNDKGDYAIYFSRPDITSITLTVQLAGFQNANATIAVTAGTRVRADFQLVKI